MNASTAVSPEEPVESKERSALRAVDAGDSLAQYMTHIGRVPLLSQNEEVELAKRIQRGQQARNELAADGHPTRRQAELTQRVQDGMAAFEHLILANTRLVVSVAKKYRGRGVPFQDLIQEGHIGLMRAAKKFDHRRGLKFSTYATWWIRQAITRVIADHSRTIRLPVYVSDQINRMRRLSHEMVMELHREPNPEELAEAMELPLSQVEELVRAANQPISLEQTIEEEGERELGETLPDEEGPDPEEELALSTLRKHMREALEQLPPRERRTLELRHGLVDGRVYTLEEVGQQLGVTRERARQLEAQAFRRLRHPSHRRRLLGYLRDPED
jgi:RNA polymerase primary sigma factor